MAQDKVAQHLVNALESLRKERASVESRIATIEKIINRQGAVEKAAAKVKPAKAKAAPKAKAAKAAPAPAPAKKAAAKKAPAKKAAKAASGGKNKPHWSAAARAAARERMRKYWAERRRKG